MIEVVTDWNDERSESSKFSGGAIWCHLASPENGLDVGTFAEPSLFSANFSAFWLTVAQ
jgi:hypothetical protein